MTPVDTSAEAVERVCVQLADAHKRAYPQTTCDAAAALLRALAKERDQLREERGRENDALAARVAAAEHALRIARAELVECGVSLNCNFDDTLATIDAVLSAADGEKP
jgi:hypothetical protein